MLYIIAIINSLWAMNKITLVFLFIILGISLTAKNDQVFQNLQVSSFSFEEGISHQTVYNIYKDSEGFLWFGTMYGLVHYMGAHTNVYRHEPNNKNSLSNDDVTKIFEDKNGNFWIATFGGGFNKFDIKKNKFTRYTPSSLNLIDEWNGIVWDIKQSENGKILIATDNYGIIVLNQQDNTFNAITEFNNKEDILGEKKFAISSSGEIFLISKSYKLYKFSDTSNSFIKYSFEGLDLDKVRSVYFKNHIAWIYSDGKIIRYNESTHEHEIISDKYPELKSRQNITEIFVDSKNNLWFGSLGIVAVLNYELEQVHTFSSSDTGKNKIQRGSVVSIVEDNEGTIWIGSYTGGINKIYFRENIFKSINYNEHDLTTLHGNIVSSILPVYDNELLIGTNAGISKYNKKSNSFENYFLNKSIFSIKQISETELLIGTNTGLYLTDISLNIEKHFTHNPKDENSLTAGPIICLLIDSSNNIWAGTNFGLNKIDKTTYKVTRFTDNPEINDDITGNTILSLYEDAEGYIYAGTYNGLNQYNPETNTFKLFRNDPENPNTISNNYVFSFHEDVGGNLWIGTGGGLNKFNRDNGSFELISEQHGLGNSVIFGIVEFDNHFFLSTANGISVLNLESGQTNSFTSEHGLHGNMFTARSHSMFANEIYFGGVNGLSIIDTENYFKYSVTTPIKILSVTSAEENLFPNFAYKEVDEIEIPYNTNYLRFYFTSMDFISTKNINYKYKLDGFDTTWINSYNKPFAEYAVLPPGKYQLIVKATNSTGFESSESSSLSVIVTPPFWQTWWFMLSILIVIGITIYSLHKFKLARELRYVEEIEKIREEEEIKLRKKAAEDFHDELGHRITKISLYSELLKRTLKDQESGSLTYMQKISELSSNLSSGVKDFIWTLDPGKDTLYDVAIRLKDFGDDLFDKSSISFRTSGVEEKFSDKIMPMDWRRHTMLIFKEAMNNILKYSNAKNVLLTFSIHENEIDISLTDDGDGFDLNKIKQGRGLKNIRMRAASLNGKVDIESTKGEGTSIRLHSQLS